MFSATFATYFAIQAISSSAFHADRANSSLNIFDSAIAVLIKAHFHVQIHCLNDIHFDDSKL